MAELSRGVRERAYTVMITIFLEGSWAVWGGGGLFYPSNTPDRTLIWLDLESTEGENRQVLWVLVKEKILNSSRILLSDRSPPWSGGDPSSV